jgi:hypothetical protein
MIGKVENFFITSVYILFYFYNKVVFKMDRLSHIHLHVELGQSLKYNSNQIFFKNLQSQ